MWLVDRPNVMDRPKRMSNGIWLFVFDCVKFDWPRWFLIVCWIEFDVWETLKLYRRSSSSIFVSHIEFSVEFSQIFRSLFSIDWLWDPLNFTHFLHAFSFGVSVYVWTILSLKLRDLWRWMSVYVWDDEFFISLWIQTKKKI